MVRTHLPGPSRNERPAASASRVALPARAWICAWVAALILAAPALAGDAVKAKGKRKQATAAEQKEQAPTVEKTEETAEVKPEEKTDAPAGSNEEQDLEQKADGGKMLDRPIDPVVPRTVETQNVPGDFAYPIDPPLGFTGRSSIIPTTDPSADFVPIEDRWRMGFPEWDRYGRGHALPDDYVYEQGSWWDPYQQNVLKGDFPIMGQHTFLNILAQSLMLIDTRQSPVATGPFESTTRPNREDFFGSPNQFFYTQYTRLSFDLNHGDAGFKQPDWAVKVTPVFNFNTIDADELAFVNPNVLRGTGRDRSFLALEEYFVETKLADLSGEYDTLSLRVGSQPFNADFRGFLFQDTNRAIRLFGSLDGNREQFNLIYLRPAEKDSNSALNTMVDRRQDIFIANYFIQDFIWPGNEVTASITSNNDGPTLKFDTNSFRVRADNAGVFQPHNVNAVYFGLGSNGHIERYNLTSQFYYALGRDSQNPIGNTGQDIRAAMAAVELSYDRDWARFRTSFFWSSGDHDPNNHHATGFDTIFDSPNFAGGQFSYWQRQGLGLFGVNLTNRESLVPDLRASKIQGQSNFVNPGLLLFNLGVDFDITPRLKMINNVNFLWFESTKVLETFLFDGNIAHRIGTDISSGFLYRPLASNNIQFTLGVSLLIPGDGLEALYDNKKDTVDPLVAAFFQSIFQF